MEHSSAVILNSLVLFFKLLTTYHAQQWTILFSCLWYMNIYFFSYLVFKFLTVNLFSYVGPLTETSLPVDTLTRKIKGFAFITFMMPEHAVTAFTELDGTTFQVSNSWQTNLSCISVYSDTLKLKLKGGKKTMFYWPGWPENCLSKNILWMLFVSNLHWTTQ